MRKKLICEFSKVFLKTPLTISMDFSDKCMLVNFIEHNVLKEYESINAFGVYALLNDLADAASEVCEGVA